MSVEDPQRSGRPLTANHEAVLSCIGDWGGPVTGKQIARGTCLSPQTIGYCLDVLRKRGLVISEGKTTDRRHRLAESPREPEQTPPSAPPRAETAPAPPSGATPATTPAAAQPTTPSAPPPSAGVDKLKWLRDPELYTLGSLVVALEQLDSETRERVLTYINARYGRSPKLWGHHGVDISRSLE